METKSQALIKQIKEIKQQKKITYNDILDALTENGIPALSLTTLRRVFANNSETRASSFNYEETLLPIAEAMKRIAGDSDDSPQATEIKALKTAISIQHEELDRILEIKEHLEASTQFFTEQINEKDKLIKRLIDRLDQKDEIIQQFINDMKRKDIIIDKLMEKCM